MSKLIKLVGTELSEYCLNILSKHDIHLVPEFILEKPEKLMKMLNLNADQVQKIKTELKRIFGPVHIDFGAKLIGLVEVGHLNYRATFSFFDGNTLVEVKSNSQCFLTCIGPLDDLLGPHLIIRNQKNGDKMYDLSPSHLTSKLIWEICGPSGVGKTQLALTLMVNFIQLHHSEALYIDTKMDFSATRVKNMLKARQLKPELVAGTLQAIKVERVLSAQGVVEMLETFYAELRNGSDNVKGIKMIVIDSLPAVWFLLKADSNRLAGKWLLSRLAQIIYRLCDVAIAVICVNLSVIPSEENQRSSAVVVCNDDHDISDILEDDELAYETKNLNYRQVMGHFWLSKPRLRLSMEYISEEDKDIRRSHRRILKIVHSCMHKKGYCTVRISDQGLV